MHTIQYNMYIQKQYNMQYMQKDNNYTNYAYVYTHEILNIHIFFCSPTSRGALESSTASALCKACTAMCLWQSTRKPKKLQPPKRAGGKTTHKQTQQTTLTPEQGKARQYIYLHLFF